MQVFRYRDVPAEKVTAEGARKTSVRWLISDKTGAPNFAMRLFEIEQGGCTPKHTHDWEHETFVVSGQGVVVDGTKRRPIRTGSVVYVAPGDLHQFRNTGTKPLRILCLIPIACQC